MKLRHLRHGSVQGLPASARFPRRRKATGKLARTLVLIVVVLGFAAVSRPARHVTDQTGRSVEIPDRPERLVSLAPSITETLFALGLGDKVVGDTDYCEYPPEARSKPHIGPILNPNLERIVALKPDLVLGSREANRIETAAQLERLGIPVYGVTAQTVDGTLSSIEDLGEVLGHGIEALQLVGELRERIKRVEQRIAHRPKPKVLFVVWYRPLTTAGSRSFVADVVRRAGGASISDDLSGEWPRMSLEEALRRDPDVILFPHAESFAPSVADLAALPGWKDLRAVKEHRLYLVSDSIIRPSPRLVDALEQVAGFLHPDVDFSSQESPQ